MNSIIRKLSIEKLQSLTPSMPSIKATRRNLLELWSSRKRRKRVQRRRKLLTMTCFKIRIARMKSNLGTQGGKTLRKPTSSINFMPQVQKRTKLFIIPIISRFPLPCPLPQHLKVPYLLIASIKIFLFVKNSKELKKQWICQLEVNQLWLSQKMHYASVIIVA